MLLLVSVPADSENCWLAMASLPIVSVTPLPELAGLMVIEPPLVAMFNKAV